MHVRALVPLLVLANPSGTQESSSIDLTFAQRAFEEAQGRAKADGGELWGIELDFPLLFVDSESRQCVANRPAAGGDAELLRREGELWVGQYPDELYIANATTNWAGRRWTMLVWPVPEGELERKRLLMHESFHNAQYKLKISESGAPCNHLATHDGRLWLRLEVEALVQALLHADDEREEAAADALLFRAMRRSLFAGADATEDGVERLEGSAE